MGNSGRAAVSTVLRMSRHSNHATFDREQWQILVEVLDGHYDDRRMLENAQDVLTRAAAQPWLEEAEAIDEARRVASEQQDSEVGQ